MQRAIAADPAAIFEVLTTPSGHVAIDASGMLMSADGERVYFTTDDGLTAVRANTGALDWTYASADCDGPCTAFFITAGVGTENRPR